MRTFEQFLEDRGFQADACEATTHPDFYRLAASLYESAERAKRTLESVENGYRCNFEGNKSLITELQSKVAELEARISDGKSTLKRRNEECDCYREMLNRIATDRSLTRAQCAELAAGAIASESLPINATITRHP